MRTRRAWLGIESFGSPVPAKSDEIRGLEGGTCGLLERTLVLVRLLE